jgi:phosphoribosylglycinamide formyltransferase 2
VILVEGESADISFDNLESALAEPDTQLRLFGKPQVSGQRRMGVALARGNSIEEAREKANSVSSQVAIQL